MKSKILIIGINGSPHKNGTTAMVLNRILESSKKHGAEVKLIHLIEKKITPCKGCYSEDPKLCKYPCNIKDDMQDILKLMIKADGFVFATPTYWFNMSGLMKNFIDRLTNLATRGYKLEGKVGVFIAASKEDEGGKVFASASMALAMNHLGLMIPPYSIMFYPGKEEIVEKIKVFGLIGS
ncbi:MAG: flavodoxin family protein [Candidatus Aenigmatarchaeota archaeon]